MTDIYRIPRRQVPVLVFLVDGRTLDGTLFTDETGPGGLPEDLLHHLNAPEADFVPIVSDNEAVLLNKAAILWVRLDAAIEREANDDVLAPLRVPVQVTLAGGIGVGGSLAIVMPPERRRVVDYLNAAGRFLPVLGDGTVTFVQRRFVVSVRSDQVA